MSITKDDDLNFERCFPSGDRNDYQDIEFNKDGVTIDYDTICWGDIRKAYKTLFDKELDT